MHKILAYIFQLELKHKIIQILLKMLLFKVILMNCFQCILNVQLQFQWQCGI